MKLTTERLYLRKLEREDVAPFLSYRSDRIVNRYQGWIPETVEDAYQFIENIADKPDMPGTWFQLAVTERCSSDLIGDIGVHFIKTETGTVELGCTLDSRYHGNGYAFEALEAVTDYLLRDMKKNKLQAWIMDANVNSIRLFEKLGFRHVTDDDGYRVYELSADGLKRQ